MAGIAEIHRNNSVPYVRFTPLETGGWPFRGSKRTSCEGRGRYSSGKRGKVETLRKIRIQTGTDVGQRASSQPRASYQALPCTHDDEEMVIPRETGHPS